MSGLKKSIVEAIKTYNKYRSPEAEAKLIKYEDNELFIELKGPFVMLAVFIITLRTLYTN